MVIIRFCLPVIFLSLINLFCNAQNEISVSSDNGYEIINEVILPKDLKETSGLLYVDSLLLSFNDSGNKSVLFGLDPVSGKIKYQWEIQNVKNNDWEDIAQDNNFLYIGDFGNNFGKRKDLAIYKIKKQDLFFDKENVQAEIICFMFEDQTSYTASFYQHSFDCEAIICFSDSIYIFSKDWKNLKTASYALPKTPGYHVAKKTDIFDSRGLITGADFQEEKNILIFTGYLDFKPFLWIFKEFQGSDFFSGSNQRIDLTTIAGIQNEGICFLNNGNILLSSEKKHTPATLFYIVINNL